MASYFVQLYVGYPHYFAMDLVATDPMYFSIGKVVAQYTAIHLFVDESKIKKFIVVPHMRDA